MEPRRISDLDPGELEAVFERDAGIDEVRDRVQEVVDRVRAEGDRALGHFAAKYDDVELSAFDVTADVERAYDEVDPGTRAAIDSAAENIRAFHERQVREGWQADFDGRELGRQFHPLGRVGVYVPGGYPSSALMAIIPARIAGVSEVVVATPPSEPMNRAVLAAIHAAGADTVYSVGGPAAIAALAYGTESVDPVPKIVGPGSHWVSAGKACVRGDVETDFIAGPSESLTVADETADPAYVAADVLAQAEHTPNNVVAAVTPDPEIAREIVEEIDEQLGDLDRADTIRESLSQPASGVFIAESMSAATEFAERFAPEHLSIQADDEELVLDRVRSAASVFLGPFAPVAAGDYGSGTNAILPTNGLPRVTGGLSVDEFVRSRTIQRFSKGALEAFGETATSLAETEGFDGHAASIRIRMDGE